MLNGIAPYSPYPLSALQAPQAAQGAVMRTAVPAAQPETPAMPVTPVRPAVPVHSGPLDRSGMLLRWENDPAAMAVRSRIQYGGESAEDAGAASGLQDAPETAEGAGSQSVQETAEEAECQTCKERKYQDGSDDPGVSFKTAAHIDPDQAAAVVRGHEQEHVVREQAKANREDREVVSQSVTLHSGICPECGRTYVSGGTTRTVTRANQDSAAPEEESQDAGQNAA